MQLGIDFGTTRTVVAMAEDGNHPVVEFVDEDGDWHAHWPSVSAVQDGRWLHGHHALAAHRTGTPLVRSAKRLLGAPNVTPETVVQLAGTRVRLLDLLTGQLTALRDDLAHASSLSAEDLSDPVVVGVPAHATSGQRMLTLEAFARAGFQVDSMVNEPSAAGIEFADRQRRQVSAKRGRVLVYDLGGGTFDASLVDVRDEDHRVLASVGLDRLGGDDLDLVLVETVLAAAGVAEADLDGAAQLQLLDDCRAAKEALTPQSRRIAVEVLGRMVSVPAADFQEAATRLLQPTLDLLDPLVAQLDGGQAELAGIYLVGGSSSLPLVPRLLRERFGRRVFRSPQPGAATAIGLAIVADPASRVMLHERLSRGLGVFREWEQGREVAFDAVLMPDRALQEEVRRRYRAAHTVGWYRFAEFSRLDDQGQPVGGLSPRGHLVFPFAPGLELREGLELEPVARLDDGPLVEETYRIDGNGVITVEVTNLDTGLSRSVAMA